MIRFYKDLKRCPYLPKDPGYVEWNRVDNERLEQLDKSRKALRDTAHQYMSHEDRNVRNLAIFTSSMLVDNDLANGINPATCL